MKFFKNREEVEQVNLNLTPMIDLFVSLIAFLLLCAAFVRYGGVVVEVPRAESKNDVQQKPNPKKLGLTFEVVDDQVMITGYNSEFTAPVPEVKAKFSITDLDGMKSYLQGLHQKYPEMGISIFHASASTRYEVAMTVLDAMKTSKAVDNVVLGAGVVE